MIRVLLDTGPLVAILSTKDEHHQACLEVLRGLVGPPLTCWPVITEAAWLLRQYPQAVRRLMTAIGEGAIELLPLAAGDAASIAAVMQKYQSLAPQLADATLVALANREKIDTIFTLDRRDFSAYRYGRSQRFRLLP